MTEIDKILSTLQTIAWVWMCMRYLVSPLFHFILARASKEKNT